MNLFLVFFLSLYTMISGEQLYHREGRFIDLSINKYKTNLPSIHDIANTFIHYRMPVAVFIPTVRLNIRAKQRRTPYSTFPSAPKKLQISQEETQNQQKLPVGNDQDQLKSSKQDIVPTTNLISRNGWAARSLSRPRSNYKPTRNEQLLKRLNLNYASMPESNVDLIPFLYKDNLPATSQPISLFNSQYQLTNSNPNRVFSQNIAYIQPNSVSPFQPNIVLLPLPNGEYRSNNQSLVNNQNLSLPIDSITLKSNNQTVNSALNQNRPIESINGTSAISQFDISQVGENPTEIEAENVQNHESLDNIPVSPLNSSLNESNSSLVNPISNDTPLNNGTENVANYSNSLPFNSLTMIPNLTNTDRNTEKQLVAEPIIDGDNPYQLSVEDNGLRSKLTRLSTQNNNPIRSKYLDSARSHRSLVVDMPSIASYLTAAVAQSGHSNEQRKIMYTKFLNSYN